MNAANGTSQNPFMSVFGGILGVGRDTAQTAAEIVSAKWLLDLSDGELGLNIDPSNRDGRFGIAATNTTGSAAPTSIWRSYDMLFIGAAAVLIVGAIALRN
jgi:hypothetical protein